MTYTNEAAPQQHGASDLISVLGHRAPRVAMTIAATQFVWPLAKKLHTRARDHFTYTVKLLSTDEIYDDVHEWVLGLLPPTRQRALVAWTSKNSGAVLAAVDEPAAPPAPRVRLRYDGSREQAITIAGHKIRVVVNEGEMGSKGTRWKPSEIVFTAATRDGQRAVCLLRSTTSPRGTASRSAPRASGC